MTQLESARAGIITAQMAQVAADEGRSTEYIRQGVADGTIVIPANVNHKNLKATGVGLGLKTKVNANIGTSTDCGNIQSEEEKLQTAIEAGAHAVMDLSTGGNLTQIRRRIIEQSSVMIGTVPIYQAGCLAIEKYGAIIKMTEEDLFEAISEHCADGVDFITVHCGVTRQAVKRLKEQGRITNITSRGGSIMAAWMELHDKENPLYQQYDRLLAIAKEYDVTLSLGDAMRPGCLADGSDRAQIEELITLGELVKRAKNYGVQVMVEGPGHLPMDQIEANIKMQKSLCENAPFYILGPLVTDIAAGYDHITSAIGGAIAAAAGADFLCYVTPAEHLALPDTQDVHDGVVASLIAGHAADIVKGIPGAMERDIKMSKARAALDWQTQAELALDPVRFKQVHNARVTHTENACSMCGQFCAIKMADDYLKK
ncbi:MAG: phosphomethylpyrimidine synthase ThiC [Chloroflexi bacterium]|nr:phosphomethylpyrimidine synthase ThiC [Chloroflexota bacterium]